jgi:hypothetical protein
MDHQPGADLFHGISGPNRFQSIYWRTGVFTYTMPIVLAIGLLYLFSLNLNRNELSPVDFILSALLGFVITAFSEAAGATLATLLLLILLICGYSSLKKQTWAKKILPLVLTALFFAVFALVVMLLSPANEPRQAAAYPHGTTSLPVAAGLAARSPGFYLSIFSGIACSPKHLAILFFALGLLIRRDHPFTMDNNQDGVILRIAITDIFFTFLLVMATHAPTAWINQVPPDDRTFIITRFALLVGTALLFGLLGFGLEEKPTWKSFDESCLPSCCLSPALIWAVRSA